MDCTATFKVMIFYFPGLIAVYLLKNVMTVIVAVVLFGTSYGSLLKDGLKSELGTIKWEHAILSVGLGLIFDFVLPCTTTLVAIKYWDSITNRSKFIIEKLLYEHDKVIY